MNVTPLVDVVLVLLIIFLITVPVVITTVPVKLPKATNQATITKPENIVIAVDASGKIYWNAVQVPDSATLTTKLSAICFLAS
jgi:biopolymer transport protein ExbD